MQGKPRSQWLGTVPIMGIRFTCPNGHKLHVKAFLAGRRGSCPQCGAKVLIPMPPEEQPQELAAVTAESRRVGPAQATVPVSGGLTDFGSQSIVISVTESSLPNTATGTTPVMPTPVGPAPAPVVSTGLDIEPIALEPVPSNAPIRITDAVEATSPATRYVVQRERNRRNQFLFAIALLIAVIVLAAVLVIVLRRGAGTAPIQNKAPVSRHDASSPRHIALTSDRYFTARGALVANE